MPAYGILGACNPRIAHLAIGMEPRVGSMLPCDVILREVTGGVEVNAVDSGCVDARRLRTRNFLVLPSDSWKPAWAAFRLGLRSRLLDAGR